MRAHTHRLALSGRICTDRRGAVEEVNQFTMMTGKSVKDVDRYQTVLNSLLALEENKYCADCESKGRRLSADTMVSA